MNKKYESINSLSILCILGMFTVMSLLLIVLGANFYQKLSDKVTSTDKVRASLNYVANKIRFSGNDKVDIKEINGVKVLQITEDGYMDLIYYYNKNIMEVSIISEDNFNPEYGTAIIAIENFSFNKEDENFITFSIEDSENNPIELKVYTNKMGVS